MFQGNADCVNLKAFNQLLWVNLSKIQVNEVADVMELAGLYVTSNLKSFEGGYSFWLSSDLSKSV